MTGQMWTPEREAEVIARAQAGETARAIAGALDVTRNAVIGKLRRLGERGRWNPPPLRLRLARILERTPQPPGPTYRQTWRALATRSATPDAAEPLSLDDRLGYARVKQLGDHRSCVYVIGDPKQPDWRWCGASTRGAGESYCAEHRAHVWLPERKGH